MCVSVIPSPLILKSESLLLHKISLSVLNFNVIGELQHWALAVFCLIGRLPFPKGRLS